MQEFKERRKPGGFYWKNNSMEMSSQPCLFVCLFANNWDCLLILNHSELDMEIDEGVGGKKGSYFAFSHEIISVFEHNTCILVQIKEPKDLKMTHWSLGSKGTRTELLLKFRDIQI